MKRDALQAVNRLIQWRQIFTSIWRNGGTAIFFQKPCKELRKPIQSLSLWEDIPWCTPDNYQKSTSSS